MVVEKKGEFLSKGWFLVVVFASLFLLVAAVFAATWVSTFNDNLMVYWTFNESAGNSIPDAYGGNVNATLGAGTANWTVGDSAKIGGGLSFDNSQWVNTSIGYLGTGTEAWSFSFWFYDTGMASNDRVLSKGSGDAEVAVYKTASTNQYLYGTVVSGPTVKNTNFGVLPRIWTHIVLVQNGTDLNVYVNATLNDTISLGGAAPIRTSRDLLIGTYFGNVGANLGDFIIDELAIYNRSLNASEVTDLYNSGDGMTLGQAVANTAPTISAYLNVSTVYNGTWFNASGDYADGDGDVGTVYVNLSVGDVVVASETFSSVVDGASVSWYVDPANWSSGDALSVKFTAYDSSLLFANSSNISVSNSVPSASVSINVGSVYNWTFVNVSTTVSDDDGNLTSVYFNLSVGGSFTAQYGVDSVANGGSASFIVHPDNWTVNQVLNFSVLAFDTEFAVSSSLIRNVNSSGTDLNINFSRVQNGSGVEVNLTTFAVGGANVTFNVTISDPFNLVSTVFVKVWKSVKATGDVLWEGVLTLANGFYTLVMPTNTSFGHYVNLSIFVNDTFLGAENYTNATFFYNHLPSVPLLFSPINNSNVSDNTPTLSWNNSADGDLDTITYLLEVDDVFSFSSVNYRNTSVAQTSNNTNDTATSLADGVWYWRVKAFDSFQNSSWSTIYNLTVDTLLPNIGIGAPGNASYSSARSELNFSVSDLHLSSCWFNLNNGSSVNGTLQCHENLTGLSSVEGANTWSFYANDSVGNENVSSVAFLVDTVVPNIAISAPGNVSYTSVVSELNFTVSDSYLSSCWFNLNNGSGNVSLACTGNISGVDSDQGGVQWQFFANDSVGNENLSTVSFFVDSIVPGIEFTVGTEADGGAVARLNVFVNVSVNETNLANITFTLHNSSGVVNSTVFSSLVSSFNWTDLADTNYTYQVNVTDVLNQRNRTGLRTITLDTVSPVAVINSPGVDRAFSTSASSFNVSLNFSVTDSNVGVCWFNATVDYGGTVNQLETGAVESFVCGTGVLDGFVFSNPRGAGVVGVSYYRLIVAGNDTAGNVADVRSNFSISWIVSSGGSPPAEGSGGGGATSGVPDVAVVEGVLNVSNVTGVGLVEMSIFDAIKNRTTNIAVNVFDDVNVPTLKKIISFLDGNIGFRELAIIVLVFSILVLLIKMSVGSRKSGKGGGFVVTG